MHRGGDQHGCPAFITISMQIVITQHLAHDIIFHTFIKVCFSTLLYRYRLANCVGSSDLSDNIIHGPMQFFSFEYVYNVGADTGFRKVCVCVWGGGGST